MNTITINDKEILTKYSSYELQLKFINFLHSEMKIDTIDLFSVSIDDVDKNTKTAYDESFKDVFIQY